MRIWVDGWQMQCCGELFAIGSSVRWTTCAPDGDYLATFLGDEEAQVDAAEEHHSGDAEELEEVSGTVTAIAALFGRYAPLPGSPNMLFPSLGSGVLFAREEATGWEEEVESMQFVGYVVELDLEAHQRPVDRRLQ